MRHLVTTAVLLLVAGVARADDESPFSIETTLPYGQAPIDYHAESADDPIARLGRRIEAGEVVLRHEPTTGYLKSLLAALDVPVESQLLVFSKTALNVTLIEPGRPRAVYFDDDVYVGWVPGTKAIEVSVDDPVKGGVFYTLSQDPEQPVRFERQARCLACHAGGTTLKVPGHLARSYLVDERARPQTGYGRVTHELPLAKRFGGWYVTGDLGGVSHLGNLRNPAEAARREAEPGYQTNLESLDGLVDLSAYPSPHSDAVAHLVFHHQLHGRNLITRVGYEARLGLRSDAEDQLLQYLFFVDEPEFEFPVTGTSGYREWFESRGPRDPRGRSLRTLNLETRLFEYRLSPLVLADSFTALPDDIRERTWSRIDAVLAGENPSPEFERIPGAERAAIREILDATRSAEE